MNKIILCPNPGRDRGLKSAANVYALLKNSGYEVSVCPVYDMENSCELVPEIKLMPLEDELKTADMLICFGGDGTILRTARAAVNHRTPILGINLGTMGFIAELERCDTELLLKAVGGEYTIDERMMLDVTIERGGMKVHSDFALNDVVVRGVARIIRLSVYGDDRIITRYSGDGVIVATPTGSTAYSMSAGGPIVDPDTNNIIITPISAHAMAAKAFVVSPEREIKIEVGKLSRKTAYFSVDGGASVNLEGGDVITIKKSGYSTRFVRVSQRSFYEKVNEKLGESK